MRLLVSWLRDFVDVAAPPQELADRLALRGFEVASIERVGEDDAVIDFEVTANRPDCLSVVGFAREVATLYDLPMAVPSPDAGARIPIAPVPVGESDRVSVELEDAELCPRYAAAAADVTIGPSPAWLASRLQAAGIRPINNLVDITNYVLVELGHPMHAFDLARLAGSTLRIRRARFGEGLRTLDGIERKLEPDMLVIADRDHAQAIAGVMGGAASEVSASTETVVFESAYFKPAAIRRTSKRLGLKTEASARFERGADISLPVVAIARGVALLERIGAGRLVGPAVDCYPSPRGPKPSHLRRERLAQLLGARIPDAEVARILERLGLAVSPAADGWDVAVPTFRVDLVREIDLIEEVARHYGFDRLPSTFPPQVAPAPPPDPRVARDQAVRRVLTAAGLSEAVTFGFIDMDAADAFRSSSPSDVVALENPLSAKFAVLRPSLMPGLVDAVAHNRRHGRRDVRLFEIGASFAGTTGETRSVAVAWTGAATDEHWSGAAREVDFFDVKGIAEQLCALNGVAPRFAATREPFFAAGQAAVVKVAGGPLRNTIVGRLGQIAPGIAEARGLPRHDCVFVAELDLDALWFARVEADEATRPLPRYPSVVRDLSIVVADTLPAAIIRGTIQAAGERTAAPLVGVTFFDRYHGKGVPEGAVSVSVRLTFQAVDRTLTDADVQQSFDQIVAALVREHGAIQR